MKRLPVILTFTFIITLACVFISCSSDDNSPTDPNNENPDDTQEYQLPDIGVESIEIPSAVSVAAESGNTGATQAVSVIEMVNSVEGYYQQFDIDGTLSKLRNCNVINGWTKSWQLNELTVTLEYEDGWGDIIFLNMYLDGTDGVYTYNHWLKGYFTTSLDPEFFEGTLQMYEFGNPTPQIYFHWGEEEITGKYMEAQILQIFTIKYVYQMPGEADGYSGFNYKDGYYNWTVDIYPDGHGKWTQYADENFETIISQGTW